MKRLRKCEFKKMYKTELVYGYFHKWSVYSEMIDNGKVMSTAVGIIEDYDRQVHLAFASTIKFLED